MLLKMEVMVFDAISYPLESKENPHRTKFGGHPNAEGCKIWAGAFCEKLIKIGVLNEV